MAKRSIGGVGAGIGRRIGSWLSSTWGRDIDSVLRSSRDLSGPLVRALLDTFVVDKLVASIWPPLAILALLIAIRTATPEIVGIELRKALIGLVVLFAILWGTFSTVAGLRAAWPHIRLWLTTRLGPVRHTRLVLFNLIRKYHEGFLAGATGQGFFGDVLEASIQALEKQRHISPTRIAFTFADHLAPMVVRHLYVRLALIVGPVIAALTYYRFEIYPDVIARDTHMRAWSIALYPLALAADLVAGTHLRNALP